MPAPPANLNAIRHGLTTGAMPRGCAYIKRQVTLMRQMCESAVLEAKGQIALMDAATIQTACEWTAHGLKARHWARQQNAKLTLDQRIAFSRETARAFTERDRCLRALGLDSRDLAHDATGPKINPSMDPRAALTDPDDFSPPPAADPPGDDQPADDPESSTTAGQDGQPDDVGD